MARIKSQFDLVSLIERFNSEEKCREYLAAIRWPDGVECPRCSNKSVSRIKERDQYDCNSCRYQFSVRAGTIFHDSHLPLWKWFLAVYLIIESKKGVSANQISRTLKVAYKTAWYLCHRIRAAMKETEPELLKGIVEVDETYIGGTMHGRGRRYVGNKATVVGAVERGDGRIRLKMIAKTNRATLHKFIRDNVEPTAEAIYTDQLPAYLGIADEDTRHETVNHTIKQWVQGDVHTNTIENVWSLFKRSIIGSYHKLSVKHLDAYLDEMEFRFNNRTNPFLFRDTMQRLIASSNLEYKTLTQEQPQ